MYFGNEESDTIDRLAQGVIRKTLTLGKNIQLCWLKMDGGIDVPEHAHPEEQAGYILDGKFEVLIGQEKKVLEKGDYFRIPGNVPHSGFVHKDTILIDIYSPPK